jgi:5,10-methylene-tetrahydrofolate dehydrogenase/methenyl tetrahydrofolate cyclohydrolase
LAIALYCQESRIEDFNKIWKSKTILPGMVGDATVKVLLNQLLQPPSTF